MSSTKPTIKKQTKNSSNKQFAEANLMYIQSIELKFLDTIDKAISSGSKEDIDYWIQRYNMYKNEENMYMDGEDNVHVY